MTPPTEKISSISKYSLPSALAWAPLVSKANPLILKKHSSIVTQTSSLDLGHSALGSVAPFPAPVQAEAFTVPRPVILEPLSPWGQPVERVDFLALWRTGSVRTESEFPKPPLRADRSADSFGGRNCSPC